MSLIENGKLNHFWSTDGVECLWCHTKRSYEQVKAWRESGEPDEPCPHAADEVQR